MLRVLPSSLAFALFLVVMVPQSASSSQEQGCQFDGVLLDCSGGKKRPKWSSVLKAFASEKTRQLLSDPHEQVTRFTKPINREQFRTSVEASWKLINKYDRYSRRLLKQGKITDEEYLQRVATHRAASKTYETAYWFYKNLNWLQ